jgi:hypothetical protein
MTKKNMFKLFINKINDRKLLTKFIINIFDYEGLQDHNYIFRMIDGNNEVIIDIYDNVSDNRFNRYIFSFIDNDYVFKVLEEGNVFVNYISVLNMVDSNNKLEKLAYLFKLDEDEMLDYANTFLNKIFVDILEEIIKK